jgi:hypothetical protein
MPTVVIPVIPAIVGQDQPRMVADLAAPLTTVARMTNVTRMGPVLVIPAVTVGAGQVRPRTRLGASQRSEEGEEDQNQVSHGVS